MPVERVRKVVTTMSRYVRGVLLPAGNAPLLTVREALFSIWGGLALLVATAYVTGEMVLPMSTEQPTMLRLGASAAVAAGVVFAISMIAAGVRNRIVQVMNEMLEAAEEAERAQGGVDRHPVGIRVDEEDPGEDG